MTAVISMSSPLLRPIHSPGFQSCRLDTNGPRSIPSESIRRKRNGITTCYPVWTSERLMLRYSPPPILLLESRCLWTQSSKTSGRSRVRSDKGATRTSLVAPLSQGSQLFGSDVLFDHGTAASARSFAGEVARASPGRPEDHRED